MFCITHALDYHPFLESTFSSFRKGLPEYGHVDKNTGDEPYHEDGDCGPQDLSPVPPEGHLLGLGLGCHPDGKQGDEEGGKVCEEMSSVRGDGQGVAEHPAHDLGDHEEQT